MDWEELKKGVKKLSPDKIRISNKSNKSAFVSNVSYNSSIIDLHGYTLQSAFEVLNDFFKFHFDNNSRDILVITGKGREDQENSIRLEVRRWLEYTNLKSYILSYSSAPANQGGEGALQIRLRRRKIKE